MPQEHQVETSAMLLSCKSAIEALEIQVQEMGQQIQNSAAGEEQALEFSAAFRLNTTSRLDGIEASLDRIVTAVRLQESRGGGESRKLPSCEQFLRGLPNLPKQISQEMP